MKFNTNDIQKKKDSNYIKDYMKLRIKTVLNLFRKNDKESKNICNYDGFISVVKNLKLPEKYFVDETLKSIFYEFSDNNHNFKYEEFLDKVSQIKEESDFFNYKMKNLENIVQKIEEDKNNLNNLIIENQDIINKESQKINEIKKNYFDLMNEKSKKKEEKKICEPNGMQPSSEFTNKAFSNSQIHFLKMKEIKESLSPTIGLLRGKI